jgi:hypothetical protein
MNDDSLDKLFNAKAREQEDRYPSHWPTPDAVWRSLTNRRNRARRKKILWRVAASVLVVMTTGYIFFLQNKAQDTANPDREYATLSVKEQSAINYIARYCEEKNISCNTPVITELRKDLEQSFRKLEEIDDQLQVYGNDAELVRAKARIESHQARLIKTIVQTL